MPVFRSAGERGGAVRRPRTGSSARLRIRLELSRSGVLRLRCCAHCGASGAGEAGCRQGRFPGTPGGWAWHGGLTGRWLPPRNPLTGGDSPPPARQPAGPVHPCTGGHAAKPVSSCPSSPNPGTVPASRFPLVVPRAAHGPARITHSGAALVITEPFQDRCHWVGTHAASRWGIMRTAQAGDGPGQRAVPERNLGTPGEPAGAQHVLLHATTG